MKNVVDMSWSAEFFQRTEGLDDAPRAGRPPKRSRPKPGYDEPLDSQGIDSDPVFREMLRLINTLSVHTVSSCQGHEDREPYITCAIGQSIDRACEVLLAAGGRISSSSPPGFIVATFSKGWRWETSMCGLKARYPIFR